MSTSHVVKINDSAGDAKPEPIILRMSPGEERPISLRIVNLGNPTNVRLAIGGAISRAVELDKVNHYIVLEETVAITARMPQDGGMLDGEILVQSDSKSLRIPMSIDEPEDDMQYGVLDDVHGDFDDPKEERVGHHGDDDDSDNGGDDDLPSAWTVRSERSDRRDYEPAREDDTIPFPKRGDNDIQPIDRGYLYKDDPPFDLDRDAISIPAVPIAMLLALIVLMVLTFYTRSIPEFPGALASSLMIVSLIIYGTATLLKA